MATPGHDPPQREHRGVGGEDRRARRRAGSARARGRAPPRAPGTTSSAASSSPPYLNRSASSAARSPLATRCSSPSPSGSKSTSQIHETSRPSAIPSLSAISAVAGAAAVDERPDRLVRARRVLDQQDQHGAVVADRDPLEAAERGAEARETRRDLVERRAERPGERGRGERVVDVVEPGKGELDPPRPLGRDEVERRAVEPAQLELPRRDVERRPRVPAGRAAVVAEVADVRGRVVVRRAADDAVLRVGRVLERRAARGAGRRGRSGPRRPGRGRARRRAGRRR